MPGGGLGQRDGPLPRCKGFRLRQYHRPVLPPGQAAGKAGWQPQLSWHGGQPRGEIGRQVCLVAHGILPHAVSAQHGQGVAVPGALLGAVVAVDGVRRACTGEALGRARTGAAAAVHAAAVFAPDGWGLARTSCPGAGAAAGRADQVWVGIPCGVQVRVVSGVNLGGGGWHGRVLAMRFVLCSYYYRL
jgi:hypothetical protein